MPAPAGSLYDALGVSPDANAHAIAMAYKRHVEEFAKPSTAPDARREALIRTAYETLSDPARRDEYDASLASRKVERPKIDTRRFVPYAVAAVVVLSGAAWFVMRKPSAPPAPPAKSAQEIQIDAARAVGRVKSIEMSGAAADLGLAFFVGGRTMATTCHGIVVGSQLVVMVGKDIAARVSVADEESDVCKIAVDSSGATPLGIAATEAKAGDRVFVPAVNAAGAVTLLEGSVKGVVTEGKRRLVELTLPAPAANGAPVLDGQSRVVGMVTSVHEGPATRQLALPGASIDQAQSRAKSP